MCVSRLSLQDVFTPHNVEGKNCPKRKDGICHWGLGHEMPNSSEVSPNPG